MERSFSRLEDLDSLDNSLEVDNIRLSYMLEINTPTLSCTESCIKSCELYTQASHEIDEKTVVNHKQKQ
jgi:hypothetical protein